jgi:hypothetical protein
VMLALGHHLNRAAQRSSVSIISLGEALLP